MEYIRQLARLTKNDLLFAGGKGANLGELTQAGLPIPPGFVVLTSAYQAFLAYNGLQPAIEQLMMSLKASTDLASAEQISLAIRSIFAEASLPPDIIGEITEAYKGMTCGTVVVRSSAIAEDMPGASFAGQYESYLNRHSRAELLESVQHCWSSLWTTRALFYRMRQGTASEQIALGVIVQEQVPASSSGVLFTINPLSGNENEILINATLGLGEALVSGQVTPESILVDKSNGLIKQASIGNTEIALSDYAETGIDEIVLTDYAEAGDDEPGKVTEQQARRALSGAQIRQLVLLARKIEAHFGMPQDIEWAATAQMMYIVQSRPITTSAPQQAANGIPIPPGDDGWNREQDRAPQAIDLWTRTNTGENLPFPITPLTDTNFPAVFGLDKPDPKQTYQVTRRIYGRMYLNEGGLVYNFHKEFGLPASFLTRTLGTTQRSSYPTTFHILRLVRKLPTLLNGMNASNGKSKQAKHNAEQFFAQINAWVAEFRARDMSAMSDRELWQAGLPVWRSRGEYAFGTNLRLSTRGSIYYVLAWLVKRWTGQKNLAQELIASPSGVLSSAISPALWQMAECLKELQLEQIVQQDNPLTALQELRNLPEAQAFIELLTKFLAVHGHRCPNELEFFNPRWEEAPEQVISLVANYLKQHINPIEVLEKQQQRRAKSVALIEGQIGPIRRAIFRFLLTQVQDAITVRENSKYHMSKFLYPLRLIYAELGRRWQGRDWFKQADDIFFLVIKEIQEICERGLATVSARELQERIEQRRIAYSFWLGMQAPEAIDAEGRSIREDHDTRNILTGVAASSGRVRGRARLVQTVEEAMELQAGDILVTMATDPGWTPVFPLASGLVLEIGGQLSHGAIIAREFGLPAVINIAGAMRLIHEGQMLEIDGTNGLIYLEPEQ